MPRSGTTKRSPCPDPETHPVLVALPNETVWCTVCGTTLKHGANKARHLASKKHKDNLQFSFYHPVGSDCKQQRTQDTPEYDIEPSAAGGSWGYGSQPSQPPATSNQPQTGQSSLAPPGRPMKAPNESVLAALKRDVTGEEPDLPGAGDPESDWAASDDDWGPVGNDVTVGPRLKSRCTLSLGGGSVPSA